MPTGNRHNLARSPARHGLTEQVLDELAEESRNVEKWLDADDRDEQEIIDDALFQAELIDAACDEAIDDDFDQTIKRELEIELFGEVLT